MAIELKQDASHWSSSIANLELACGPTASLHVLSTELDEPFLLGLHLIKHCRRRPHEQLDGRAHATGYLQSVKPNSSMIGYIDPGSLPQHGDFKERMALCECPPHTINVVPARPP